jgi:hypothetical protein
MRFIHYNFGFVLIVKLGYYVPAFCLKSYIFVVSKSTEIGKNISEDST